MEEKITININSIKSIYISVYFNEIKLASASGFLVYNYDELYLITNRHVVTGRNNETNECLDNNMSIPNKLKIWVPNRDDEYYKWNEINIDLYDDKENKLWLEHPKFQEKVDVVAIKLEKYNQNIFCHNIISNYKNRVKRVREFC
jgi:hypothetical protein